MKILQINSFGNLSTGNMAVELHAALLACQQQSRVAVGRNYLPKEHSFIKIGNGANVLWHALMARITDKAGFFSKGATKKLLQKIDEYQPDVVHLHNLHGYYLHIGLLFTYLKKRRIPVVWTLHDCWAFTGHCCYFSQASCDKWKQGCRRCPQKTSYPKSLFVDSSSWNYQRKKDLFSGMDMRIVTVSKWLEGLVKQSFLKEYPIQTIYNGVNLEVFCPTPSDFRNRHALNQKIIVLGVASTWSERKGLQDFIRLSQMLDQRFQIVLVGLSQKQRAALPKNILALGRVDQPRALAKIYTAADVFFNASVEETFGLPNVEALACGTPVIVYNATAVCETVTSACGMVAKKREVEEVFKFLNQEKFKNILAANCLAAAKNYNSQTQFGKYLQLYREIIQQKEESYIDVRGEKI